MQKLIFTLLASGLCLANAVPLIMRGFECSGTSTEKHIDPTKYYECIGANIILKTCQIGTIYVESLQGCGKPVEIYTEPEGWDLYGQNP